MELSRYGHVVGIHLEASVSIARRSTKLPFDDPDSRVIYETWSYPPGFNGKLAMLFTRTVRKRLNDSIRRLRDRSGATPFVVMPYPSFHAYLTDVAPEKLIYLNHDDYSVYLADGKPIELVQEVRLAEQAGVIICNSRFQMNRFCQRYPAKADRIFHLPHGVHASFINPDPSFVPNPNTVCTVGYLSFRNDWQLINEVVTRLPEIQFSFVGELVTPSKTQRVDAWQELFEATMKMRNVSHVRGLQHRDTAQHYWRSAANWMPYKANLEFTKASCPMKLTDGFASGRPIISADVPECRLYPEWVTVFTSSDEAVHQIRTAVIAAHSDKGMTRAREQIAFAQRNTWANRAESFVRILDACSFK